MKLRTALNIAALGPLVASWAVPDGAIPLWSRIGLVVVGLTLLILSFVPKAD